MMKKIFFLINSLEVGGAENVVRKLSSWLTTDYDITIIILKNRSFYKINPKVKVLNLLNVRSNIFPLFFPIYVYKLRKLIRKESPHAVVSFLEWANFVNIISNKNAIISVRIHINFFRGIKSLYKIPIKLLYPRSRLILTNSEENKHDLMNYLSFNNIEVLYNPIDNKGINSKKRDYEFISVGRLVKEKNFHTLIKSFIDRNEKLLIIGDGPEINKLEFLACQSKTDNIKLISYMLRQLKASLMF